MIPAPALLIGKDDERLQQMLKSAKLEDFVEAMRHEGFTVEALRATTDEELKPPAKDAADKSRKPQQ